jgi:hypothetical protein
MVERESFIQLPAAKIGQKAVLERRLIFINNILVLHQLQLFGC